MITDKDLIEIIPTNKIFFGYFIFIILLLFLIQGVGLFISGVSLQ